MVYKHKRLQLEMCFVYPGEGGVQCLDWYHGIVDHVLDEEKFSVLIAWDTETLAANDIKKSAHS